MADSGTDAVANTPGAPAAPRARRVRDYVGFILGILGVASYLVFLDKEAYNAGWFRDLELYAEDYGLAVVVLWISLMGLRATDKTRWAIALLGVSAVWVVPGLGGLIAFPPYASLKYWFEFFDWGGWLVLLGGLIAVVSTYGRRARRDEYPSAEAIGAATVGFVLTAMGVALFAVATFLPYARMSVPTGPTGSDFVKQTLSVVQSVFHVASFPMGLEGLIWGLASFYSAPAIVGVIALLGLYRGRLGLFAVALMATAVAWASGLWSMHAPGTLLIGFWAVHAGFAMAVLGGVIAVVALRRRGAPVTDVATAYELEPGLMTEQ